MQHAGLGSCDVCMAVICEFGTAQRHRQGTCHVFCCPPYGCSMLFGWAHVTWVPLLWSMQHGSTACVAIASLHVHTGALHAPNAVSNLLPGAHVVCSKGCLCWLSSLECSCVQHAVAHGCNCNPDHAQCAVFGVRSALYFLPVVHCGRVSVSLLQQCFSSVRCAALNNAKWSEGVLHCRCVCAFDQVLRRGLATVAWWGVSVAPRCLLNGRVAVSQLTESCWCGCRQVVWMS